ncbi:MAG: hypothetical protein Tsb0032_43450 [Kiloniellaceae bacterium]
MTPAWHGPGGHDNDNGVREDDLQAYVDGALDGRQRAAIEAYLAANPDEAARLAAYRAQNIGLHALFDAAGRDDEPPLPPRIAALAAQLDARLETQRFGTPGCDPDANAGPARRRAGFGLRARAAAAALLLSAGTAGWLALNQGGWQEDPLVAFTRQAAEAPLQLASSAASGSRPPRSAVQGNAGQGNAGQGNALQGNARQGDVVSWLAAQPGEAPRRLPDLEALGFELVTERVITTAGGQPAAQLLYQDGDGRKVTLYMRAGGKAGQTSFTFARDGEAAQFFWQDGHMAYSLVGKMAQDRLLRIAEAVSASLRGQIDTAPAPVAPPAQLDSAAQPPVIESLPPVEDGLQAPQRALPSPEDLEAPKET